MEKTEILAKLSGAVNSIIAQHENELRLIVTQRDAYRNEREHLTTERTQLRNEVNQYKRQIAELTAKLKISAESAAPVMKLYPDVTSAKYALSDELMAAVSVLRDSTKTSLVMKVLEAKATVERYRTTLQEGLDLINNTHQFNQSAIFNLVSRIPDPTVSQAIAHTLKEDDLRKFQLANSRLADSKAYLDIALLTAVGQTASAVAVYTEEQAIKDSPAFVVIRRLHQLLALSKQTHAVRSVRKADFEDMTKDLYEKIEVLFSDKRIAAEIRKVLGLNEFSFQNFRVQMYRIRNSCSCAFSDQNVLALSRTVDNNFSQVMPVLMALLTPAQKDVLGV